MEKMMLEKYSPMQLFQLKPFIQKHGLSVPPRPQMPPKQLSFFLKQSIEKKAPVTVQSNTGSKKHPVRECSGIPRVSVHTDDAFILEDKNTLHLCPFSSVRHIRLADE